MRYMLLLYDNPATRGAFFGPGASRWARRS
jgi:hypothetical protein